MNQIEEFVREVEKELELKLKEFNNSLNSLFEKMERELDELNRKFKSKGEDLSMCLSNNIT